jgi:hypothetical protein
MARRHLEDLDLGDLWLLLGVVVVTILVNFLIPRRAILAPIFIALMLRLGIQPQWVLAAYPADALLHPDRGLRRLGHLARDRAPGYGRRWTPWRRTTDPAGAGERS